MYSIGKTLSLYFLVLFAVFLVAYVVCVSRLEIFNCNPLDAVINEKSTLSCHTDTDSINHVSSTVSFGIDPMDVTRASAYTNATWGGQGTPYVATYDQEGFVPSNITCCVSKTSLCPAVCSDVCLFDVNVCNYDWIVLKYCNMAVRMGKDERKG